MNDDLLSVPQFSRLSDYVGAWSMESAAFAIIRQFAETMDLQAHIKEARPEPLSVVELVSGPGNKSIAIIKMSGVLMKSASSMGGTSTIQVRRELRAAAADPNVAGILLAVDSPGGTVSGTDDLAREVRVATKQKPVWVSIEDLGASAAYWAASQANRITANSPTALVGSIGTFQVIYDHSEAAAKEGVRTLLFATGAMKGLGTPGSKVTEDQATHVQALVNAVQQTFDAAVRTGRGLSAKELAAVRHGGVMTANEALDARLIDAVQPLGKTLSQFAEALRSGTAGAMPKSQTVLPMLGIFDKERPATVGSLPMLHRGLPMRPA